MLYVVLKDFSDFYFIWGNVTLSFLIFFFRCDIYLFFYLFFFLFNNTSLNHCINAPMIQYKDDPFFVFSLLSVFVCFFLLQQRTIWASEHIQYRIGLATISGCTPPLPEDNWDRLQLACDPCEEKQIR